MIIAAANGCKGVVLQLLLASCDKDKADHSNDGTTPLYLAAQKGLWEVVLQLLAGSVAAAGCLARHYMVSLNPKLVSTKRDWFTYAVTNEQYYYHWIYQENKFCRSEHTSKF